MAWCSVKAHGKLYLLYNNVPYVTSTFQLLVCILMTLYQLYRYQRDDSGGGGGGGGV